MYDAGGGGRLSAHYGAGGILSGVADGDFVLRSGVERRGTVEAGVLVGADDACAEKAGVPGEGVRVVGRTPCLRGHSRRRLIYARGLEAEVFAWRSLRQG